MNAPTMRALVTLDDKFMAREGRVFMSGTQALVRLPMVQMWRDHEAGLNTGAYISGYRGSPIGGYDQQLMRAATYLDPLDITFQPAVNEELAATAIWGSQQLYQSPGAQKDGVVGIWYGKGPGVDRCGDVFKHGNAAGTSPHGGVLCLAGDDHSAKSSTIPHQSDHAFSAAIIPMLYPSSVHEFVEMGLLGIAMSRYSGCWSAMKVISDTVETSAAVDLAGESRVFVTPTDFEMPPGGLHNRWPDPPMVQDERLQTYKGYAAQAFARANGVDLHTHRPAQARYGIVASGKAYEDVRQALQELKLDAAAMEKIGLSIYKVRMPWPLEPEGIRQFSEGLDEILVVEERREVIEFQIKQQLFNWRADVRPRIIGKFTDDGKPCLPLSEPLSAIMVARVLAERLLQLDFDAGLKVRIESRLAVLDARARASNAHDVPVVRTPYFCSGCPHNTSTKVPVGSRASAGIGCHFMAIWMDRETTGFTQMGGEGALWNGQAPFTDEEHIFVNLGDGTYFHSGYLAIRAAVAAKVNVTYKILYNDAVAMTGGQMHDGELSPEIITRQLAAEGVAPIYLVSENPDGWDRGLAPGTIVRHRDELDAVMKEVRETKGASAIVFVQTCAAEKRRRRKRGQMEDPAKRVMINPEVCEGCGDCSVQSNCVSVEPLETPFGRKRQINQSACNKDFSCVKGFCPSFVTIHGGTLRKPEAMGGPDLTDVPEPAVNRADDPVNIVVTGIGGTGVLTIGSILGMAAHLDNNASMVLDMSGLAQKGGAVVSHVRIAPNPDQVASPRIATGGAHVMIAADDVVAAGQEGMSLCNIETTTAVANTAVSPVADFVRNRDFDFKAHAVEATIRKGTREDSQFLNFTALARKVAGDTIATNIMMVGFACQLGLLPVSKDSIEAAIRLNNVAVDANLAAFGWGRVCAARPDEAAKILSGTVAPAADMTLEAVTDHWADRLRAYQGGGLAKRFRKRVSQVASVDRELAAVFAANYGKLLAYKDEYEVARLLTSEDFAASIAETMDGDFRVSYNLAPPIFSKIGSDGRPVKKEYGPGMRKWLRLLRRMKFLRGSVLDPFGRSDERQTERRLIAEYEALTVRMLPRINGSTRETIHALFALPSDIRGYGPVKDAAIKAAAEKQAVLLAELDLPETRVAAE